MESEKEESERDVLQRNLDRGHGAARTPYIPEPCWWRRLSIFNPDIGRRNPVKDVAHSGGVNRRRMTAGRATAAKDDRIHGGGVVGNDAA